MDSIPDEGLLDLLPVAVCVCEAPSGIITRYNRRAAELWGREPRLRDPDERFCGSHRLLRPDGTRIPDAATPMAEVLRTGRAARSRPAIIERPDGSRVPVLLDITPVRDAQGAMVAAINAFREITERTPGTGAASAHGSLLQMITDNATQSLFLVDARHRCTFMNPAAEQMTGFTLEEVRDRPLHACFHHTRPDGRPYPIDECPIDRALPQRNREQGEEVFVRKDGTFYPVAYTVSPIVEDGVPVGTIVEVRDISEEKRAEAELRRFKLLSDHANDAKFLIDDGGRFHYVNRVACERLGYSRSELLTMGVPDINPVHDVTRFRARFQAAQAQRIAPFETVHRRRDGSTFPVEVSPAGVTLDGRPYLFSAARDITERKRAEAEREALLRSEQAARAEAEEEHRIIETLHRIGGLLAAELDLERLLQLLTDEATALSGAQFGAFFYNALNERGESYVLYTLSGAPREAFAGFPMPRNTKIFGPTFRGEGIVRFDDVTRAPQYGQNPPYHGMPAGHLPVRSYLAAPVVSRSGEVLGGLFFGHPAPGVFTERHERLMAGVAAQAAVAVDNARLYERAQQAIRLRDDFLSIASHELKTPLTALQLASQALLREAGRGASLGQDKLDLLVRQVSRLGRLIDDLLDVSRISSGRLELQLEDVDLAAVVGDVVARLEAEFERVGVSLTVATCGRVAGTWDRLRVDQVLTNLLSNALKYGDGKPVTLTLSADADTATLTVRDLGIGIAPEHQRRIFERFERAVSSRHYGGFGLGLWIVRRIVEALGGRIGVVSEPGQGSTFTVELPRRGPRPANDAESPDATAGRGSGYGDWGPDAP